MCVGVLIGGITTPPTMEQCNQMTTDLDTGERVEVERKFIEHSLVLTSCESGKGAFKKHLASEYVHVCVLVCALALQDGAVY